MLLQCRPWRLVLLSVLLEALGALAVSGDFVARGAVLARRALRLQQEGARRNSPVLLEVGRQRSTESGPSPAEISLFPAPAPSAPVPSVAAEIAAPAGLDPGPTTTDAPSVTAGDVGGVALPIPEWLTWIPEVPHYKFAGGGYTEGSPMFRKQEAISGRDTPIPVGDVGEQVVIRDPPPLLPPVPTAMECVINLTAQFFFVYTVLFVVQTLNRRKLVDCEREEKCLVAVLETVFFVPMLCILFLAVRLRAIQLTQGKIVDLFDLPPWWVKSAMVVCTWAVLSQTLLVFALSTLSGEGDRWEASAKRQGLGLIGKTTMTLRNAATIVIYVSFTVICIGLCTMTAPTSLWGESGGPALSPAVFCVILLTLLYFAVYLGLSVARLANELGLFGRTVRFCQSQELLKSATTTVAFVPMLCALFMAARLRATQLDPLHGNPQRWVQIWFYVCTASSFLQTVLIVARSFVQTRSAQQRDITRESLRSMAAKLKAIEVARLLSMAFLCIGVVAIILGIFSSKSPENGVTTPAMPLSLQCVALLAALYFLVYLAMWVVMAAQKNSTDQATASSPTNNRSGATEWRRNNNAFATLETFFAVRAKEAVAFCPMFCVLYLGSFMRALQITDNKGAPQAWCQQLQVISSWSIVLLTFARVDVFLPRGSRVLSAVCETLQYLFFLLLYVSAILIVGALFTMTPENANGPGAVKVQ